MKTPSVGTLVPNELVTAQFLVLSKEIRQKKTGEPYLSLHLADRTGEIEAKMWDNVAEVMHTFDRDHFVKVKGLHQLYQNRSQFIIHRLRRLEDHEVEFADYFPCSDRDVDEMFTELESVIAGIKNVHLRSLLDLVFSDAELVQLYKLAPAAKSIHHACRGGLLEHVLSLCTLSQLIAAHYPEVDKDLVITGAILHDIGKIEELTYARSFGYSAEGQLLGHIVLGLRLVGRKFENLPQFPPKLRTLVEHLIVSHHGELEFGSPKVPVFAEAMLLHHLDNLDSKMNAIRSALQRDQHGENEFTGWIASLERALLKKDRYWQDSSQNSAARPGPVEVDEVPQPAAAEPPPSKEPELHAAPHVDAAPNTAETADPQVLKQASLTGMAPRIPGPPVPPLPAQTHERKTDHHRSPSNTLFGEKLQAVLEGRK